MYQRKNFAYGKVATAPSPAASGTTLVLESGQGARFPNTSGGTYVCVVKQANLPATPDNAEVVLVTSHDPANDNFTITREQEGSGARTIEVGDEFYLSPTDGVWDQIDVLTTKGDLMGFDTAYARIPVGANDYVLTADSTDDQGVAWKAIGAESKIIGEVPTGTVDGSNDDFELSEEPFSGTLQVYLNGVRQKITDDYTLSGTTITFITPPLTGSSILCDFNQNVSPSGNADTLDGLHSSSFDQVGTNKLITAAPGSDHTASGLTITLAAHENQAFGDVCYIAADGQAQLIDADAIASMSGIVMCADATIDANASGNYLMFGIARDDTWNWTVGGTIYGTVTGTSGNTLSQTAPTGTDDVIQILGVATHADRMIFNPQLTQVEHV